MNILEDPEPYSNIDDEYASFEDAFQKPLSNKTIPTRIHFIPNIPIPPIPTKDLLLTTDTLGTFIKDLPDTIELSPTTHIHFLNNTYFKDSLPTLPKLKQHITTFNQSNTELDIDDRIIITIYYSLRIKMHSKLESCMKLEQSIGESNTLTDILLKPRQNIPQLQQPTQPITARRRRGFAHQRNQPGLTQTTLEQFNIRNLLTGNIENMLTNIIQQQQQQARIAPLVNYDVQLATLESMGFTDTISNRFALRRAMGNVNRAVELLIQSQTGEPTDSDDDI